MCCCGFLCRNVCACWAIGASFWCAMTAVDGRDQRIVEEEGSGFSSALFLPQRKLCVLFLTWFDRAVEVGVDT